MGTVRAQITNLLGIINGQLQDFSPLIDVQGRISVVILEKGLSDCNIYLRGKRVTNNNVCC